MLFSEPETHRLKELGQSENIQPASLKQRMQPNYGYICTQYYHWFCKNYVTNLPQIF